jgi:mannose-1-phosphate guanylyltransferase/phosphomannomutase
MSIQKPAIFLDRDGTINKLNGFITNYEQIEIIPNSSAAIKKLKDLGFLIIVVTNQPVIERGLISQSELETLHKKLNRALAEDGGDVDAFLFCPHEDSINRVNKTLANVCKCRKPASGLIDEALAKFKIDLSKSWVIGDSWRDVELAKNTGISYFQIIERNKVENLDPNQVYSLAEAVVLIEKKLKFNQI